MLVITCLMRAKIAQISGNLTCANFCDAPCTRSIPFLPATTMQCEAGGSHPARILWKTLVAARYPLSGDCWLLRTLQGLAMNAINSESTTKVRFVGNMLQPGPLALRFPSFPNRPQRQRLPQTRHLRLVVHRSLHCSCGCHRFEMGERGGRGGGAVWCPLGATDANSNRVPSVDQNAPQPIVTPVRIVLGSDHDVKNLQLLAPAIFPRPVVTTTAISLNFFCQLGSGPARYAIL